MSHYILIAEKKKKKSSRGKIDTDQGDRVIPVCYSTPSQDFSHVVVIGNVQVSVILVVQQLTPRMQLQYAQILRF